MVLCIKAPCQNANDGKSVHTSLIRLGSHAISLPYADLLYLAILFYSETSR